MIETLILFAILGVVWYFLRPRVASPFREFVEVVAIIVFCLWLLRAFGVSAPSFRL